MMTRMQSIVHAVFKKKRSNAPFDTVPTRWSWARQIESYEEIPDIYKGFFQSLLESGQLFPYTLQTPSFNRFMFKSNEKLVCDLGREIVILESFGDTVETKRYPIEAISYFEVRTILLDSQIKLCGLTKDGTSTSSTLKFNSVTDYFFDPILKKIRLAHVDAKNISQTSESGKFDSLMDVNFKFMNYARRSVLAGEKVVHFILQSEIQTKLLKLFGITYYRTIHPAHIVILTNWELIIIREEKIESDRGKYGGIWDFVPLNKIEKLSTSMKDDNLFVLSIQLPGIDSLEVPFQVSAREEVDRLLANFEKLTARE